MTNKFTNRGWERFKTGEDFFVVEMAVNLSEDYSEFSTDISFLSKS